MAAAKNSRKRSEARSPAAAISAGTAVVIVPALTTAGTDPSSTWSDDAARRDAGKFLGALKVGGERVPVWAGRAAGDAPAERVAGMPGGIIPWLVVGHWAFNGKEPLIVVGDD